MVAIVKAEHISTKGFGCLALVVKCAVHQNEVNKIEMTAESWTNALFYFASTTVNSCCQRFLCLLVVNFSNHQILDNRISQIIVRPFFKILSICLSGFKAEQTRFWLSEVEANCDHRKKCLALFYLFGMTRFHPKLTYDIVHQELK